MNPDSSKITIHMVSSLDGFIAGKDGSIDWMQAKDTYEKGISLTEEDIAAFLDRIDCYVMGARTYEQALELGWPYGDVPVVVVTRRNLKTDRTTVEFYSGDLDQLVQDYLKPKYRNIWMVGGATLAKAFIQAKLADEIVISIMPVIVGGGTLFFDFIGIEQALHLLDVKAYKDGMVEPSYAVRKYG